VIAGALLSLRRDLHLGSAEQGALVALLPLGAMVGSLLNGRVADTLGRRRTLLLNGAVFLVGTALTALAPGYWTLLAGRAIVGLAVGSTSSTVPLYLSELAPPAVRGRVVSANQLMITLGIVAGYAVDYAFASSGSWRAMFGAGAVPAAAFVLGMLRAPETPAWIDARSRGEPTKPDVRALLRAPLVAPLGVGVGLAVIQQFAGINAVLYYVPSVMEQTGLDASDSILSSVIVGAVNVVATVAAFPLVDRLGRRPLLLASLAGMLVSLALLGLTLVADLGGSRLALLSILAYIVAFAIGLGPVFWIVVSEVFPARARAVGAGVATAVNWFSTFLVGLVFLPLVDAVGQGQTFWIFAGVCAIGLVFVHRSVPETKGRSFEEIEAAYSSRGGTDAARAAAADLNRGGGTARS
jgi:SP family galactose:H+ symporter-like MFS transporter